uniref:Cell division protein DamX, binds to the septal ring, contains C-terminal SPOR domain n=1 Tax=Candidatus Kentrum sp. LFY TaxID=2126342 RepID=A0A450V516_9GAMM|nr:MAG: Cell division protein DamX, binds to the septal ring, contains C-terminal SPOR domain [Candidatus Kentron sp. LFY]VFK18745.1 MAG: Cell division protein DamX, binds to the septal ring, contains C-terminal SPOR domain [Candidatus Kentron sp. LFY]
MINKHFQHREIAFDPFLESSTGDFFFPTQALTQRLDLFRHLIRSGGFLLILTGECGAGKSTLLKQLLASADPQWDIHSIPPTVQTGNRPHLATGDVKSPDPLLERRDVFVPEQDTGSIRDILLGCTEMSPDSDRIPLIIVDDSKALSSEDLQFLVEFSRGGEEQGLRIILVCPPEDMRRVREFAMASGDELTHTVDIPPLDEEQVGDYLHLRWNQNAPVGDDPFTDRVIRSIYHASKGLPANVNRLADRFLQNRRSNPNRGTRAGGTRAVGSLVSSVFATRKRRMMTIVGGIILIIIFFPLLIADHEPQPVTKTQTLSIFPEPAADRTEVEPRVSAINRENDGIASGVASPQRAPLPSLTAIPQAFTPRQPAPAPPIESFRSDGVASGPADSTSRTVSSAATVKPFHITPSREIDHRYKDTKPPLAKIDTAPKDNKISPENEPYSRKQKRVVVSERGSVRTIAWLRRQNSKHYTIQLLGTSNKERMQEFFAKHKLGSQAAWFKTWHNGRGWFVVVYGIYPTHEAATAKIRVLPRTLRNLSPWPRNVGDILAVTSNG